VVDGNRQLKLFAGGCPAASHFSCLAKKNNQKKSPPVRRPCGVPSIFRQQAGLRNSPWRGTQNVPHCGAQTVLA
ncbi:MAG: hypothetical protein Q7U91_04510, partial [Sideroxyarcus sp.]|nr:hypothetical protein [Sideroxyarcus sp.]